jgi:hypothetical protein
MAFFEANRVREISKHQLIGHGVIKPTIKQQQW